MASGLASLSPITVCDKVLPTPPLFGNIPMIHLILEEVLEDWLRSVEPYQRRVDGADSDVTKKSAVVSGFMELQPAFLKSLFSYAFFFVAAENAYDYFFKELDRAKRLSGLKLEDRKRPEKTPFVRKVRRIRNIAIAHFPSDQADPITAFAAMSWQPMSLAGSQEGGADLEKLTFVPGRFRGRDTQGRSMESKDLEVPGIKTAHYEHCLPYLEQYDEVCCEYLSALRDEMNKGRPLLGNSEER